MPNEPSPWLETCPECGAEQYSPDAPCWLCGLRPDGSHEPRTAPVTPGPRPQAPPPPRPMSFSLATMMLLMTLAAVWLGLLAAAPGLAILVCILLVPVLVRTARVVRVREERGRPVSPGEKIALALTSFGVTFVILSVTCVAAVGTFCAVCIGLASAANSRGGSEIGLFMVFAGVAALVVTVVLIRLFAKWARIRYRRDIGEES